MKRLVLFLMVLMVAVMCQSCFTTRTSVGDYRISKKVDKASSYNYSKVKQVYMFWGLVPLGRARAAVPSHGNCEIRTGFGFGDFLVSLLTGGLISMQTVKVKAPRVTIDSKTPATGGQPVIYTVPSQAPATESPQKPAVEKDAELEEIKKMLN